MKLIEPQAFIWYPLYNEDARDILLLIESAGRVAYRSHYKDYEGRNETFIRKLISKGHESVLEHSLFSVLLICDRGVSHELVRHRLASYTQESTRYVKYTGDIDFIQPSTYENWPENIKTAFINSLRCAEETYQHLLSQKITPQEARAVLPNALATKIVMTANLREWRHVFNLRLSNAAHPDMQHLMRIVFKLAYQYFPPVFEDIKEKYNA